MNARQALAAARTIIGQNATITDSGHPSSQEMRDAARARFDALKIERDAAVAVEKESYAKWLADTKDIRAATALAEKRLNECFYECRRYRVRVGSAIGGMFNKIKAEGDNYADAIEKLREGKK